MEADESLAGVDRLASPGLEGDGEGGKGPEGLCWLPPPPPGPQQPLTLTVGQPVEEDPTPKLGSFDLPPTIAPITNEGPSNNLQPEPSDGLWPGEASLEAHGASGHPHAQLSTSAEGGAGPAVAQQAYDAATVDDDGRDITDAHWANSSSLPPAAPPLSSQTRSTRVGAGKRKQPSPGGARTVPAGPSSSSSSSSAAAAVGEWVEQYAPAQEGAVDRDPRQQQQQHQHREAPPEAAALVLSDPAADQTPAVNAVLTDEAIRQALDRVLLDHFATAISSIGGGARPPTLSAPLHAAGVDNDDDGDDIGLNDVPSSSAISRPLTPASSPSILKLALFYPAAAQKSYANEKRFLTPAPVVKLSLSQPRHPPSAADEEEREEQRAVEGVLKVAVLSTAIGSGSVGGEDAPPSPQQQVGTPTAEQRKQVTLSLPSYAAVAVNIGPATLDRAVDVDTSTNSRRIDASVAGQVAFDGVFIGGQPMTLSLAPSFSAPPPPMSPTARAMMSGLAAVNADDSESFVAAGGSTLGNENDSLDPTLRSAGLVPVTTAATAVPEAEPPAVVPQPRPKGKQKGKQPPGGAAGLSTWRLRIELASLALSPSFSTSGVGRSELDEREMGANEGWSSGRPRKRIKVGSPLLPP